MAAEHKGFITKQVEKWGKDTLVPEKRQNELLRQTLVGVVSLARESSNSQLKADDVVHKFMSEGRSLSLRDLNLNYAAASNYWKKAFDEDGRYLAVNIKYNIQAVFFRILTTLAIGFSIMLVYWVAHCLEIPMPLLRLPIS
jgi:hypothetical protein